MSCRLNLSKLVSKSVLAWVLLILGLLIVPFAITSLWLRITLLETDQFVKTLSPLSTNPAIVSSVSKNISGNFFQNIDAEKKVREALPENSQFLAPSLTVNLESFVENQGRNLVISKEFNQVWVTIIKTLHPQIMYTLEGKGDLLTTQNGMVTLDFKEMIAPLTKQLETRGVNIFDNVTINTKIVFLQSDKLAKIQSVVKLILGLGVILPILALVLIIGAVLASSHHRKFLVYVGLGLSLSMILLLYLIYLGQQQFIGASEELSVEATSAFYQIMTHSLQQSAVGMLIFGIALSLGANYLPKKLHIK